MTSSSSGKSASVPAGVLTTCVSNCIKLHFHVYEGRKEMFLFNHTLNTFYLWLYDVGHMVKVGFCASWCLDNLCE